MADKRVIKVETLDRLAKGFQESRGITDKLSLDEMAILAAEPLGGEDRLIPFINGDPNMVLTESDLADLTNPLPSYTFADKTFKSISLPPHITEIKDNIIIFSEFEVFKTYASAMGRSALAFIQDNSHIYLLADEFTSLGYGLIQTDNQNITANIHFNNENAFMSFLKIISDSTTEIMYNRIRRNIYYGEIPATEITVASNITNIVKNMLGWQNNLEKITFLGDITKIGTFALAGNSNLTEIDFTYCTSVPTLESNAFWSTEHLNQIKVPAALYDEWIAATNWANYARKIVA